MSVYYKIGQTFYRSEQQGKKEARAKLDKGRTLGVFKCVTTLKGKDLEIAILNGETPWEETPCGTIKGKKGTPKTLVDQVRDGDWNVNPTDENTDWIYKKGVPVMVPKGSVPAEDVINWGV